ncbi:hypothetical protein EI42_06175 [Thermosporothrix hazakensis]|uniref:Uncharacterized protein n=1 Tax=Thermosporothrix hazakensis TaxID=644383 RepID=A0A326TRH3_THEHA|nr:hypothetical protein EI42_06175 [Thermosporothrix hazakensis]
MTVGLTLTIAGVSMVGVSDPDTPTSAYAQAFKRACANHGLGAYFYRLPKVFQHQVSMDGRHNVHINVLSIVVWCYDQAGLEVPADVRQEVESLPENLRFNPQARQASSNYRSAGFQPRVQPASPVQRPATQEGQPSSMSEKQLNVLRSAGFRNEELQQMSPAHAKYIIGMYFANREQGIDALREKWYELIAKSDGRA